MQYVRNSCLNRGDIACEGGVMMVMMVMMTMMMMMRDWRELAIVRVGLDIIRIGVDAAKLDRLMDAIVGRSEIEDGADRGKDGFVGW